MDETPEQPAPPRGAVTLPQPDAPRPRTTSLQRRAAPGEGAPERIVMFRGLVVALLALSLGAAHAAESESRAFDSLLARHVAAGPDGVNRVDYAAWKASQADRAALDAYIRALEGAPISTLSRNEQFAAWANLYNAATVRVILDRYPVRSIRDIRSEGAGLSLKALIGPWQTKVVTVEGRRLSLDDIEHGIVRPAFKDPRVHYAFNCASIGCPNLMPRAFRGATLDADLDAAARAYVNHPRGVSVTARGLRLSSIYDWYGTDFGTAEQLRAHLLRYAAPDLAARIRATPAIAGYGYDWLLNDRAR